MNTAVKIVMNEEEEDFAYPIRQVCMPLMFTLKNKAVMENVSDSECESESESAEDDCSCDMADEQDDQFEFNNGDDYF